MGEETPRDRDGRVSSDSGTPSVALTTTVTEQRNRGDETGRGLSGFRAKPVAVRCKADAWRLAIFTDVHMLKSMWT